MWYGWKTVFTSSGAENQNEDIFATELTYPDAVKRKKHIELFAPTMLIMMVMKK